MALRKATQEDLEKFKKVSELEVVAYEECDTVDQDGNDVPGLKVDLPHKIKVEASLPLANGKPLAWEEQYVYVTGEDVAKFKQDLYTDDETGKLVYRGSLKQDVSKPWFNQKGECTKRPRIKLTSMYHADFKRSGQKQTADVRAKALATMFGFEVETPAAADTTQKAGSLNLSMENAPGN